MQCLQSTIKQNAVKRGTPVSSSKKCLFTSFTWVEIRLFIFLLLSSKSTACVTGSIWRFKIGLVFFSFLVIPSSEVNKPLCLVEANTKYITNFKIVQLLCSLYKQLKRLNLRTFKCVQRAKAWAWRGGCWVSPGAPAAVRPALLASSLPRHKPRPGRRGLACDPLPSPATSPGPAPRPRLWGPFLSRWEHPPTKATWSPPLSPCLQYLHYPIISFIFIPVNLFFYFNFFFSFGCVGSCCCAQTFSSWSYSSLRCAGFSLQWLLFLRSTGSRRAGFSSCGSRALERRLSSCGARA